MLRASSTSSSDSGTQPRLAARLRAGARAWRPAGSLAWCLGFLLVLRVALAVGADALGRVPGGVDDADWRGAAVALQGAPRVAVFGSSRIRDALPAPVLARALGLPAEEVVNASLSAATPWELVALLRRDPELLRGTELVLTDTQLWQWNGALGSWVPRPLFLRHASLADRLGLPGPLERTRALVDWAWPAWSERRRIGQWARGPRDDWPAPGPNFVERPPGFDPEPQAAAHAAGYRRSALTARSFRELARQVAERGARLIVLQPPTRSAYPEWLERHAPEALADYRAALAELAHDGVEVVVWERPGSVGLPDRAFFDYGHLRPAAAAHFARVVAARVAGPALAAGASLAAGATLPAVDGADAR